MKTNRLEFNLASTESRDMDNEEQVLFMDIYSRSRQRNDCVMIWVKPWLPRYIVASNYL